MEVIAFSTTGPHDTRVMKIKWERPERERGDDLLGERPSKYEVEVRTLGTEEWKLKIAGIEHERFSDYTATVKQLQKNVNVQVRVIAVYDNFRFASDPTYYYNEHSFRKSTIRY